jgi:Skp family chaperone for outer membrane proteins
MAGLRGHWCAAALILAVAAAPVLAQDANPAAAGVTSAPILTLDQDRFFIESRFGRATLDREAQETAALEAENTRIEQELIAEEQSLTELRKTLTAEEFAERARAFDEKVERIRDEQDAKARDLTQARDGERQAFLRVAVPVLGELMAEKGAVVIVDKASVILSLTAIDITDEAIARVDQAGSPTPTAP